MFSFYCVNEYITAVTAERLPRGELGVSLDVANLLATVRVFCWWSRANIHCASLADSTPGDECVWAHWAVVRQSARCPIALNTIDLNSYRLNAIEKLRTQVEN